MLVAPILAYEGVAIFCTWVCVRGAMKGWRHLRSRTIPNKDSESLSHSRQYRADGVESVIQRQGRSDTLKRLTVFEGEMKEAVTAAQFELGADVGAVRFDGARTDEQFGGDFATGLFLGYQFQDA